MIYKKKCKICGKEFETDKVNKTICNDIHYTKYVICSNSVELKNILLYSCNQAVYQCIK